MPYSSDGMADELPRTSQTHFEFLLAPSGAQEGKSCDSPEASECYPGGCGDGLGISGGLECSWQLWGRSGGGLGPLLRRLNPILLSCGNNGQA